MELEEVKSFILERTLKMAEKAGNRLPCGTQNGIYHYKDDGGWTGGFAMAYAYTGRKEFLEASKKTAKVFLDNLEDNYLPKWDFSLKGRKDMPIDASAAVICSSGLLELSKLCENYEAMQYRAAAIRLAEAVWEHCALKNGEDSDGLITGCTGFYNENAEVNQNLIFGDYYFVETIAMLLGIEKLTQ